MKNIFIVWDFERVQIMKKFYKDFKGDNKGDNISIVSSDGDMTIDNKMAGFDR